MLFKPNKHRRMKTLGKRIRLLRHQNGWSQEDVAKKLEISIPAFSKIETGITDVNLSRIEQIAKLFDLSIVDLLTFDDSEEQKKYDEHLKVLNERLKESEAEVVRLQKKVIELYEGSRK